MWVTKFILSSGHQRAALLPPSCLPSFRQKTSADSGQFRPILEGCQGLHCLLPGHGLGLGLRARHWCPRGVLCLLRMLVYLTQPLIKFLLDSLPELDPHPGSWFQWPRNSAWPWCSVDLLCCTSPPPGKPLKWVGATSSPPNSRLFSFALGLRTRLL